MAGEKKRKGLKKKNTHFLFFSQQPMSEKNLSQSGACSPWGPRDTAVGIVKEAISPRRLSLGLVPSERDAGGSRA